MFRRALLAVAVVLATVSSGVVLAFAADFSRVGRALSNRVPWMEESYTPVHAAGDALHAPTDSSHGGIDAAPGTYCPVPAVDVRPSIVAVERGPPMATRQDSSASLVLQGQSLIQPLQTTAICTGVTPALGTPAVTPP